MKASSKAYFNFRLFDGVRETLQDGKIVLTKGDRIHAVENLPELDHAEGRSQRL